MLTRSRWVGSALVLFTLFVLAVPTEVLAGRLNAEEAGGHIGEQATVCGKVADARWASGSKGQPTFLNFGKPYPNHAFTALIWGRNRAKFGTPEKEYLGKNICVEGWIGEYQGKAQIEVREPRQMSTQ